jgi:hypothetical protein
MQNTVICPVCLNEITAYSTGVMTVQVAHHFRNDGALCPGSGQTRSRAT